MTPILKNGLTSFMNVCQVTGAMFHSVKHVFDISVDAEPLQTLSAMFYDCIYYNVDGGLSFKMNEMLKGIIV
eukprot:CAMPEP_0171323776 /NCGR_PEP_ID=MMETSP0816-20121228/115791_1 /TAXON_ID=420281 /ORGANISM="Proboscia inermis, Strain CCAP1064/1" /LENGTH=71 /DNA_ID=CAMNT_0011822577 /DNA_START=371 /DNA_END=586 /DNA_ORIENTATION=+